MSEDKIYSFIGLARKAGAVALGESMAHQAVKHEKAQLVLITHDAADNTRKKIETALYGSSVPSVVFGTKEKLGHILGKTFLSVIAVTEKGFAEKINKMIEQNQNDDYTAHGGGFIEQTKNS